MNELPTRNRNDSTSTAAKKSEPKRIGSGLQAEVKTLVLRLNAALVQLGIMAEVVYDPQKLSRIVISNLELKLVVVNDAESRLKELERLYEERLITAEVYRTKRDEIINAL